MSYFKKLYYRFIGKTPDKMEMVQYWKTKESVAAKIIKTKDGIQMKMEGEKHPFPTFPRGHILLAGNGEYSKLSVLKHQIKNKIFNDSWYSFDTRSTGDNE